MVTADTARRGEVWEYVQGSRQYRVLIISNDEYNELSGATPWAVTVERGAPAIPGFVVPLAADDPLTGATAVIPRVMRCDATALRHNLGLVSNTTMNRIERGLREFLDLP